MGDIPVDAITRTRVAADEDKAAHDDAVTVLVTGFGPFLDKFPKNASWEIASRLPSALYAAKTPINILVHPSPITVAYHTCAPLIPHLLSTHNPDLVLHLGLAANRTHYAIERSSSRHGFARTPDVEGRRFLREDLENQGWHQCPERIETGLDFGDVWARWEDEVKRVPGLVGGAKDRGGRVDIRAGDDVGSFLCGFVYFASLAWFWKRGRGDGEGAGGEAETGEEEEGRGSGVEDRPVIFLHVPDCPGERDVGKGVLVTEALIKALVESWLAGREKL